MGIAFITPIMDRKSFSFLALGLLVGMLASSMLFSHFSAKDAGSGSSAKVLKLAHALDQSHPVHAAMEFMAKRLDELSGGTLEVQIFPNGQLGGETDSIEQLKTGALAMVKTSAATMEGFVPEMAVFGLPYLFRDSDHYWIVLNGPIGKELLAKGEKVGLKGLMYYDSGSRSFYTIDKPILTPDDLSDMKIRVMRSQVSMKMISNMGGSPTPIPWGELYTALQQGMVDGAENNPPSLESSRHYEVAKYYSLDEHTRIPDIVLFSQSIWEGLSPVEQEWIQKAADESVVYQRKLWAEKSEEAMEKVKAQGVKVYNPDKAPFLEKMQPMLKSYDGTEIGDYIKRIQEVK